MKKRCVVLMAAALFATGVAGTGCETLDPLFGDILRAAPKPEATLKHVRFVDLDTKGVTLAFTVDVTNPYSVPLPVADAAYELASGDATFLSGEAALARAIPAKGTETFELPATINFASLLGAVKTLKPGALVPYAAKLNFSADSPTGDKIQLPVSHKGELPIPAVPEVALDGIAWDKVSLQQASGVMKLRLKNTNQFAAELSNLDYDLALGGRSLVKGASAKKIDFAAGGEQTVEIPIAFSTTSLGLAPSTSSRRARRTTASRGSSTWKRRSGRWTLTTRRAARQACR